MIDKRIVRTKKNIEEALFTLLREKDINKITVKELTASIDINRSTFYAHYNDVYDLLESVQDRVLVEISEIYKSVTISSFQSEDFKELYLFLEYIKANKETFDVLLNGHGNILFVEKLKRAITEKLFADFMSKSPNIKKENYVILSSFFIAGCLGIIQNWLKNDTEMSTEKLTELIKNMIFSAIRAV